MKISYSPFPLFLFRIMNDVMDDDDFITKIKNKKRKQRLVSDDGRGCCCLHRSASVDFHPARNRSGS